MKELLKPKWYWRWFPPNMSKDDAELEIDRIRNSYIDHFGENGCQHGFLVGSSLCANEEGDSARFWEMKRIINFYTTQH